MAITIIILLFYAVVTEQLTVNSQTETLCTNVTGLIDLTLIVPNSNGEDCICPLLFLEQDCYAFENCLCASILGTTSLVVCIATASNLNICITNVTESSQIYFVQALLLPHCTGTLTFYRRYIKALNIISGSCYYCNYCI